MIRCHKKVVDRADRERGVGLHRESTRADVEDDDRSILWPHEVANLSANLDSRMPAPFFAFLIGHRSRFIIRHALRSP